jgi:hypothetical protein
MEERAISEQQILGVIDVPDRIHVSTKTSKRFIAKKLVRTNHGQHLLMVIYEVNERETVIVTIIDTSKIEKYY